MKSKYIKVAVPQKGQVWELRFCNDGQRYFVKTLDIAGALNIWKEERSSMDVMVESRRSAQVAEMLHERDIPYSVAIGNLESMIEREKGNACKKTKNAEVRTMDWKNYYRLDVIYAFLEDLAAQYPYLCTVSVIGKSAEGRDLRMIKISNGNDDNTAVWIDGTIHPREWVSTSVVTYIIDQLVRNFHEQPESVTNKDWYILPVLNPDGYEYTHTNDRMWRKNRARYGECVGVDLNRNFSYGWGEKGEEGSSEDPGSIFYRGPKPFSEPETAAVKRVILENEGKFKVFLSFHSYGEVVIFPWGYTPDPCPDYVELLEGGTAMAKAIYDTNGHTYKVGSTKDLMYYAAGNSTDWSYGVANIPYSYMVELRSKQHRFLLPKDEIAATANEVMNGVFRLMDFVDRRCRGTMDWKNYYRLDVIYAFLEDLAAQYPYLCTVSVIGKSAEGRDLRMIKISNGNDDNTAVWIDGTIHPREWVSTSVVTYIIDQLVRNFHEQPESVTNKDWYILPVLNPDGYEYTHTNDRMWRKNRARYGECVGVDLNRNFSYGWGEKGEEGSSEDPGSIFYRGPKPFSEPETAAVKRVILENEGKFKVFLSFHSYGEVVIFPWGYTPDPCPDYVELLEGGTAMAKAIYDTNGHTYKVGSTKDLMYYAAGNSTDWSYGVANIPYSYMVELRSKQHRFLLPKDEIAATANEVMNGVFRLMDFVDRRCRGTQSCFCPK